ncbi:MAG: preprotein translocase subunit YajC [Nitriliruptorales bacterium]|nr:preprotein translocase subunit YajC [Nitriliruptorales bacterium]
MDFTFLILLGFFALMYFVMIRPQQKRQKKHQEMLSNLTVDDDVVTIGGLHGTVVALGEGTVDLKVTDDVVLRFQRSSVANVVGDEDVELEHDDSTTEA